MRFSQETLQQIKKQYREHRGSSNVRLNIEDSAMGGAQILDGNWGICRVSEMDHLIEELQALKEAITEVTGIEEF